MNNFLREFANSLKESTQCVDRNAGEPDHSVDPNASGFTPASGAQSIDPDQGGSGQTSSPPSAADSADNGASSAPVSQDAYQSADAGASDCPDASFGCHSGDDDGLDLEGPVATVEKIGEELALHVAEHVSGLGKKVAGGVLTLGKLVVDIATGPGDTKPHEYVPPPPQSQDGDDGVSDSAPSSFSEAYQQGYHDGLNGEDSHPGPLTGESLADYKKGYASGCYQFSQQSPLK